jgi:hypothetical protein
MQQICEQRPEQGILEGCEIIVPLSFSIVWTEFTGKKVSIKVGFLFGLEEQIVRL